MVLIKNIIKFEVPYRANQSRTEVTKFLGDD